MTDTDLTPEQVEAMERGAKNVLANPSDVSYLAYHYATLIVALAADWKRQREQIAALQTKTPPPARANSRGDRVL